MDDRRALFIYDIYVDPAWRGRGLGRAAMLLADEEARVRGIRRVELNVFGGNAVARRLYLSLGYVERAVLMAQDTVLRTGDLGLRGGGAAPRLEDLPLEEVERVLIQKALDRHEGNVSHAAKALGLSRSALYRRLQHYGL